MGEIKKIIKVLAIFLGVIFGLTVITYIYWPFAEGYINERRTEGDAVMHLANIISIKRDHPFPIMAWKTEWAGYPLIEGYPWLHYYLIQPVLSFWQNPGIAMDYYSAGFLLLYYILSFLLLFKVSKNLFLSLLFSLVLVYGADSQLGLTVMAFVVFIASLFFLPLILILTIYAREKESSKALILSAIVLSIAFFAHGAMTGIVIIPIIFPFLILNKHGRLTRESLTGTIRYLILFALLSALQIYQFVSYNAQGYLRGVKPFPLEIIPDRLIKLFSWVNPVMVILLVIFLPLFIGAVIKNFSQIKAYLLSFLFIVFVFILMVFNITSMNLVLLAERALWAMSLSFLLLFSRVVYVLAGHSKKKILAVEIVSVAVMGIYLYLTLLVKSPYLVPDVLRPYGPYAYTLGQKFERKEIDSSVPEEMKNINKYDYLIKSRVLPSWSRNFNNFRTDGISYNVYSSWNIWSPSTRYKGRFPAAKGLPLVWSGLETAALYGRLGEAGTFDDGQLALNQTVFWFDWYGIKYIESTKIDLDLADYLKKEPLIANKETIDSAVYYTLDDNLVSPMYLPTEAKTMAVISPETQYNNFIQTLSFSTLTSRRIIPIYLGSSLRSLNQENLKYFDAIFLYGYKKSILAPNIWDTLLAYVNNGGKLMIETGQKVGETVNPKLPEVFPIKASMMEVIDKPCNVEIGQGELTKGVAKEDFTPLKTKYTPYAISEGKPENLRNWAQPVLFKDGNVVIAYGQLGKGSVVWSGLNLPFHAIDNRNISETVIFANILNWFFPEISNPINTNTYSVSHPRLEEIVVKSNQGKGVLLKENYNPGWSAKLNGKKTKIYKAGLFEMYIPFSERGVNEVTLKYQGVPLHWMLFGVSTMTLIGILIYLLFNRNLLVILDKIIKFRKKSYEEDY